MNVPAPNIAQFPTATGEAMQKAISAKQAPASIAATAIAAIQSERETYTARIHAKRDDIKARRQKRRGLTAEYHKRMAEIDADLESDADELDQLTACIAVLSKTAVDLDTATKASPKAARKRKAK